MAEQAPIDVAGHDLEDLGKVGDALQQPVEFIDVVEHQGRGSGIGQAAGQRALAWAFVVPTLLLVLCVALFAQLAWFGTRSDIARLRQ